MSKWALVWEAFVWSTCASLSLPLGAVLALLYDFDEHFIALAMAYGAGALLFALSVEIFAEALRIEHMRNGHARMVVMTVGAIVGPLMYIWAKRKLTAPPSPPPPPPPDRLPLLHPGRQSEGAGLLTHGAGLAVGESSHERQHRGGIYTQGAEEGVELSSASKLQVSVASEHFVLHEQSTCLDTQRALGNAEEDNQQIAQQEQALRDHAGGIAVYLGLFMDAFPESMVIGFLTEHGSLSMAFLLGIFLSNLPEAMASSLLLKRSKGPCVVLGMWLLMAAMMGVGSAVTVLVFPARGPDSPAFIGMIEAGAEGWAGGAMLCMIACAALPEAYHRGGENVGLFCVLGFLTALWVQALAHDAIDPCPH